MEEAVKILEEAEPQIEETFLKAALLNNIGVAKSMLFLSKFDKYVHKDEAKRDMFTQIVLQREAVTLLENFQVESELKCLTKTEKLSDEERKLITENPKEIVKFALNLPLDQSYNTEVLKIISGHNKTESSVRFLTHSASSKILALLAEYLTMFGYFKHSILFSSMLLHYVTIVFSME